MLPNLFKNRIFENFCIVIIKNTKNIEWLLSTFYRNQTLYENIFYTVLHCIKFSTILIISSSYKFTIIFMKIGDFIRMAIINVLQKFTTMRNFKNCIQFNTFIISI